MAMINIVCVRDFVYPSLNIWTQEFHDQNDSVQSSENDDPAPSTQQMLRMPTEDTKVQQSINNPSEQEQIDEIDK